MSDCCSACKVEILEHQARIKCAGQCGEVFHVTCAKANEYNKTNGVEKNVTSEENLKNANSRRFEGKQHLGTHILDEDLFSQEVQSLKQDMFRGLDDDFGFGSLFGSVNLTKCDTEYNEIKKQLSELRTENEVLRKENFSITNRLKVLEIKVDNDTKMFDEFRKVLRNLSKNLDENNKLVEKLKEELKEVRTLNENLEDDNNGLVGQVNVLENKVNELERSVKTLTEKSVVPSGSGTVAVRRADVGTGRELERKLPGKQMVVMAGATQKHSSFAVEAMGSKPVTALAGIGPVYGGRLNQCGYYKASQLYQQFLNLNKNPAQFQIWLQSVCGANSRWAGLCYQSLYNWDINFNRDYA